MVAVGVGRPRGGETAPRVPRAGVVIHVKLMRLCIGGHQSRKVKGCEHANCNYIEAGNIVAMTVRGNRVKVSCLVGMTRKARRTEGRERDAALDGKRSEGGL